VFCHSYSHATDYEAAQTVLSVLHPVQILNIRIALQDVNIKYGGFPFKFIFPLQYSVSVSCKRCHAVALDGIYSCVQIMTNTTM
jgi:hypothetical protein